MSFRVYRYKECSNCGHESPRNYHCIVCNSIARTKRIKFVIRK